MIIKILSSLQALQGLMMGMLIAFAMTIHAPVVSAQAVRHTSDFNHMRTGFPLTGVHTGVACETCHAGGIFKGTPTNCEGCHSAGRRVVAPSKPANHLFTNEPCEACHTNTVTFLGARFNHIGVQPRTCIKCHNGSMGPGKPGGHFVTNSSCDSCHRTSAWIPAGYDHTSVVPGTCANCHNGSNPNIVSKNPAVHIVTAASCDTCHHNFNTFIGGTFDHASAGVLPNTCMNCHVTGVSGAKLKPANHIPSPNTCDVCHTLGYTSFNGPGANTNTIHATIAPTACKTCHASGTNYLGVTGDKKTVGSHEGSSASDDCSKSGCHAPLGPEGSAYNNW